MSRSEEAKKDAEHRSGSDAVHANIIRSSVGEVTTKAQSILLTEVGILLWHWSLPIWMRFPLSLSSGATHVCH